MDKIKALRIVNLMLAMAFLTVITSAAFSRYIYPTGYYRILHVGPGISFVILLTIHIYLNRKWIKSNYFKSKR